MKVNIQYIIMEQYFQENGRRKYFMEGSSVIKKLTPNEHIKQILKLPSQDFITIYYESGERKLYKKS